MFADSRRNSETDADLVARLLCASELSNIVPANNPKYWLCTRAGDLYAKNFTFVKDGYDDEVSEHYSVSLGDPPTLDDAAKFARPFGPQRRPS